MENNKLINLQSNKKKKSNLGKKTLLFSLVLFIAALVVALIWLYEKKKPEITLEQTVAFIGAKTTINLQVSDKGSGLKSAVITLNQRDKSELLARKTFPRHNPFKSGDITGSEPLEANIDPRKAGMLDGEAQIVITVRDYSWRSFFKGNETTLTLPVTIDTRAPDVIIKHSQRYIRPGGSGIVIYDLNEQANRHGVELNDNFFPGFPLEGADNLFIAFIALPYRDTKIEESRVIAVDRAGNRSEVPFRANLKNIKRKKDRINVTDSFLNPTMAKMSRHVPELTGSPLEKYLFANRILRKQNNDAIKEACGKTDAARQWQGRFLRMAGAPKAGFGDERDYYYQGKVIDNQLHLGSDIAQSANASVKAANSGKVVFAGYLGIYGNTIIMDHGQGVASLYSHLSRSSVRTDDMVEKGMEIGITGATGLAGGDHLHFSILINGIFVTSREWWDQNWLRINIEEPINDVKIGDSSTGKL